MPPPTFPTKSVFSSKYPVYFGRSHNPNCGKINGPIQICGRQAAFQNMYAASLDEANKMMTEANPSLAPMDNASFAAMDYTHRHNYRTLPSNSGANIIYLEFIPGKTPSQPVVGGRKRKSRRKKSRKNRKKTYKKH